MIRTTCPMITWCSSRITVGSATPPAESHYKLTGPIDAGYFEKTFTSAPGDSGARPKREDDS
jgi:hypothetical protein